MQIILSRSSSKQERKYYDPPRCLCFLSLPSLERPSLLTQGVLHVWSNGLRPRLSRDPVEVVL